MNRRVRTPWAASGAAQAAKVTGVQIQGLDETKTLNVHGALSVVDTIGKEVSGRRLAYLLREAEDETREALEPFGYYSPQIEVERIGESDALGHAVAIYSRPKGG